MVQKLVSEVFFIFLYSVPVFLSDGSDDTEVNTESDEEIDTNIEIGIQTDKFLHICKYGCDLIKDNNTATKFYTGFPSWYHLMEQYPFNPSVGVEE